MFQMLIAIQPTTTGVYLKRGRQLTTKMLSFARIFDLCQRTARQATGMVVGICRRSTVVSKFGNRQEHKCHLTLDQLSESRHDAAGRQL